MVEFVDRLPKSDHEKWVSLGIENALIIFDELVEKPGEWALFGSRNLKEGSPNGKLACETFNALSNVFYYTFQSYIKFPRTETKIKDVGGTRFYYAKVSKTLWQKLFKK